MTLKVEVPIAKDTKNTFAVRMDVKGMMNIIENLTWKEKDRKEIKFLLQEYSKFYILDALGIKQTPSAK